MHKLFRLLVMFLAFTAAIAFLRSFGSIEIAGYLLTIVEWIRALIFAPFDAIAAWVNSLGIPLKITNAEKDTIFLFTLFISLAVYPMFRFVYKTVGSKAMRWVGEASTLGTSFLLFLALNALAFIIPVPEVAMVNPRTGAFLVMVVYGMLGILGLLMNISFLLFKRKSDPELDDALRNGGYLAEYYRAYVSTVLSAAVFGTIFYFMGDLSPRF